MLLSWPWLGLSSSFLDYITNRYWLYNFDSFTDFKDLPMVVAPLPIQPPVVPNRKTNKYWCTGTWIKAPRVTGWHSDVLPSSLCSRELELQRLERRGYLNGQWQGSSMVFYTLTVPKYMGLEVGVWVKRRSGRLNPRCCWCQRLKDTKTQLIWGCPWIYTLFVI